MKRCPECGFRADDHTCPLCGVRMRNLPGEALEQKTHVHRQQGEQCTLPNRKPEQQVSKIEEAGGHRNRWRSAGSTAPVFSKIWQIIAVVLIAVLFRACTG